MGGLLTSWFHFDSLAVLMISVVGFLGVCVLGFASRYMAGDRLRTKSLLTLGAMLLSVMAMVSADNIWILLASWMFANLFLVRVMIHNSKWQAAKAAGQLAAVTLGFGALCLAVAFLLMSQHTGLVSIQALNASDASGSQMTMALGVLLLGALTQSAIFPFHTWLLSSLNSPTPVSAIMHAGLVNGGGVLLARFAPLYLEVSSLLFVIFALGFLTAVLGTLWKLMQHDVKRMLACSTMGQMGFMMVQCGLGLFPAAIAHLIWHGVFKAYLFLASGGTAQEKRFDLEYPPRLRTVVLAVVCGVVGSFVFAVASGKVWLAPDTTSVLVLVAGIAAAQVALTVLRKRPFVMLPVGLGVTSALAAMYGLSVQAVAMWLAPMNLMQPQSLHTLHIVAMAILVLAWLAMVLRRAPATGGRSQVWRRHAYVRALNASQPDPKTVTPYRPHYPRS